MKLITATLAVAFITLLPIKAQAYADMPIGREAICLLPKDMHAELARQGLFLYAYGVTNDPFLIAVYVNGESGFVVIGESPEISCILTDGIRLYETKRIGI